MRDLLAKEMNRTGAWAVDAQPRVALPLDKLYPSRRLVDLEHARMHDCLLPKPCGTSTAAHAACLHWYEPQPETPRALWLTGLLPQFQRFRYDPLPRDEVVFLPDEDEQTLLLHRVQDGPQRYDKLYVPVHQSLCHPLPEVRSTSPHVSHWPQVDMLEELTALAQAHGLSLQACAQRYASASLPACVQGWCWHQRLGFNKKEAS